MTYSTEIDKRGFEKGLNSLKSISSVASKAIKIAIGGIVTAITGIGTYAIKVGSEFEAGMSKVQAISGATGAEIEKLTEKAKEMGQKTKFSATESAEAFQYMAMAGWKTEDMLNGIEGIMNLAAASGEDLASVSDIVTDALTAFGLQAKDSGHFADVLAKASSNSNTNVGLMGETFKYVAPLAGSMKYSVEDTAVAIGLMANAGIKGSQAGTALRSMLTRLVKPPKDAAQALKALNISAKNSDGTMKPLSQTLQELRKKFAKLSDSQKSSYAASIAGQEAMSGMLAIVNASDSDFDKLTESINNADGASKQMADTMNDNVKGALTLLKSNLESVGIKIYDKIKEPLKKLINTISKYISQIPTLLKNVYNWINKNKEVIKVLIKIVASLTAGYLAYKSVLVAINAIQIAKNIIGTVSAFLSLIPTIRSAKDAMLLLNMAFSANPVGLVVAGVATLTTALVLLGNQETESEKKAKEFAKQIKKTKEEFEEYNYNIDKTREANLNQINVVSKLKDELKNLVDENGKVKKGYEGRVDFILKELNEALGTEYKRTGEIIEKYKDLEGEIDELIEKKKAKIKMDSIEEKYKNYIDKETESVQKHKEAIENLGTSIEEARGKYDEFLKKEEEISDKPLTLYEMFEKIGERDEMKALKEKIDAYEDTEKILKETTQAKKECIDNYALYAEGKYNEIGKTIIDTTKNWTDSSLDDIKNLITQEKENLKIYKDIYNRTGDEVSIQQVQQSKINLKNLANELVTKTKTVKELGEEEKEAWKALGEGSYEYYSVAIADMGHDMQKKIQEATGIIAAGTPEMQAMAGELGRKTVEEFDKSADAKQKALNIMTEYLNGLENEEKRKLLSEAGIENVDAVIQELDKKELSEDNGRRILEGLYDGLQNKEWKGEVLDSASGLAKVVHDGFNDNVNGLKWGSDLVSNIANGLKSKKSMGEITASAAAVAGCISDYLHHTVPEKGPLKEDDKWMFDMMDNFAQGMEKGLPKVLEKSKKVAKDIKNSFDIQKMNDDIYRKMQNAVAMETASVTAKASIKANNSMLNVIQANFSIDGSVDIDGQKAGRILAPSVTKTIKVGGLA